MAGNITGVATSFGLPNYQGQLFGLTPYDTPLLSAIGGLTGGRQTESTQLEWQTYDLRDPSSGRTRLEGATAPTRVLEKETILKEHFKGTCKGRKFRGPLKICKNSTHSVAKFTLPSISHPS